MVGERAIRCLVLAAVAGLLATAGACGGDHAATVDYARQVEALRAPADEAREAGRRDEALAGYRAALAVEAPSDGPAVVALRQDLRFAVGRLLLERGDAAAAREESDHGLALGSTDTLFSANLWALRAMASEAMGRVDEAIAAYERAQEIHARLFERALIEHREGPP